MELATFPLVEQLIVDMQAEAQGALTSAAALEMLAREFNLKGPFACAKAHGVLVNDSAEEFAIQFMTVYNSIYPGTF